MEELEATIVAVYEYVPVHQAEAWFNAVCEAHGQTEDQDWDAFVSALNEQATQAGFASDVTETFVRFVEDQVSDRWTVLRTMSENRDYLPNQYQELLEQFGAEANETEAEADDAEAYGGGTDKVYEDATGLFYDDEQRYKRDTAGVDHPLTWTEHGLYWVNVDGEDHWYDQNFQPYEASASEGVSDSEPLAEVDPAQAVATVQNDVVSSLLADHGDLADLVGPEVFEQLVAAVLRDRVAAATQ